TRGRVPRSCARWSSHGSPGAVRRRIFSGITIATAADPWSDEMAEFEILTQPPRAGGKPTSIVVMLHGVGSNCADLLGLAPYFADDLPHTEFVSPDAFEPYDMAPFGYQWFSLADRTPSVLLRELERAAPKVQAFLDGLLADRGLDESKL